MVAAPPETLASAGLDASGRWGRRRAQSLLVGHKATLAAVRVRGGWKVLDPGAMAAKPAPWIRKPSHGAHTTARRGGVCDWPPDKPLRKASGQDVPVGRVWSAVAPGG